MKRVEVIKGVTLIAAAVGRKVKAKNAGPEVTAKHFVRFEVAKDSELYKHMRAHSASKTTTARNIALEDAGSAKREVTLNTTGGVVLKNKDGSPFEGDSSFYSGADTAIVDIAYEINDEALGPKAIEQGISALYTLLGVKFIELNQDASKRQGKAPTADEALTMINGLL